MTAGVITERTDVRGDCSDRILSQFQHRVYDGRAWTYGPLEQLVRYIGDEIQLAESLTHDLITERLISTAVGAQLDQWGRRLGCKRLGMSDADFRALLYVWIAVLTSHGRASELQEIVRRLAGAASVSYRQAGRAHFVMSYDLAVPTTAQRRLMIEQALELAACLGVSWTVTEGHTTDGYFGFAENTDPNCKGFGQGGLSGLAAQVNA